MRRCLLVAVTSPHVFNHMERSPQMGRGEGASKHDTAEGPAARERDRSGRSRHPVEARIQSIGRAKALLDAMAAGTWVSLRDLAMSTGLAKTTAFNLVSALVDVGLAERDAKAGAYRLSLQHLSYGKAVERRLDIASVARPHLIRLCALTRETVNLALPCPTDSLIVESLEGSQNLRVSSYAGTRALIIRPLAGARFLPTTRRISADDLQSRKPACLDAPDHHRSGDSRSGARTNVGRSAGPPNSRKTKWAACASPHRSSIPRGGCRRREHRRPGRTVFERDIARLGGLRRPSGRDYRRNLGCFRPPSDFPSNARAIA